MNKPKILIVGLATMLLTSSTMKLTNRSEFNTPEAKIVEETEIKPSTIFMEDLKMPLTAILPEKEINVKDIQKFIEIEGKIYSLKKIKIEATGYDNCKLCTGKSPSSKGYGVTASGVRASRGTVAVPKEISLGSKLYIPSLKSYTKTELFNAHDVGGAIKKKGDVYKLDVWFPTHQEALDFGVKQLEGYILVDIK